MFLLHYQSFALIFAFCRELFSKLAHLKSLQQPDSLRYHEQRQVKWKRLMLFREDGSSNVEHGHVN